MRERRAGLAWLACGFFGAALAACGGDGARAGTATLRDSAGIAIAESTAPELGGDAAPRLAAEPSLVIGAGDGADSTQMLFRVQAVRRLRDGRVVVADGGSSQVRYYGTDGSLLRAAGGQGGGPGEFGTLAWLDLASGDSVVAYDGRQRRFAVLDDTGAFVRVVAPQQGGDAPLFPRPVALLAGGDLVATRSTVSLGGGDVPPTMNVRLRDTVALLRIAPDGAVRELPARLPAAERIIRSSPQAVEIVTPPFAHVLATTATGERVYASSGDRYEIAQYDAEGRLARLIRVAGAERPVTEADVAAHVERATADVADPAARQQRAAALRELAVPERMPAVARLIGDDAGRLWAMDYLAPRDTAATWRVFDGEGRWLATVAVPRAFTLHAVRDGRAVGVWRDEDDVEQVRVYELADGR